MDRGRPQERPHPNPSTVDRRGNAVGLHSFLWSRTYGNRNTRGVPERVLGRNWRPDPNQLPRSPRTRRTCLANPGKTSAKAVCRPGSRDRRCRQKAPASQLGCHHRRNGHWQDAHGHGYRSRVCSRTPVRLSLRRAAAIASEAGARDSADNPRRQDVCDRQPPVATTRSIWPARSQRTAASEWPHCPRWRSHHAHRHEVAGQIQIRLGPLGC